MTRRRTLILVSAVAMLIVALVAAGAFALSRGDRIAALAADRAEQQLGREVRIGEIAFDLFPIPAVTIDSVSIAGADAESEPLATVGRVLLRPQIWPLLRREIIVDELVLEGPQVYVEVDASGEFNLPEMADSAGAEEDAGGPALQVSRVELQDAGLEYRDWRTGLRVRLGELDQTLRVGGSPDPTFEGELEAVLAAKLSDTSDVEVADLPVRLTHTAAIDRDADVLTLDDVAVTVDDIALELTGAVRSLQAADPRTLDLELTADGLDIERALALAERVLGPDALENGMEPSGAADLRATVRGPLGDDGELEMAGTVGLDGVSVAVEDIDDALTGLTGDVRVWPDSVQTAGVEGRLMGRPLRASFTVRNPSAPTVEARVRTELDIERTMTLAERVLGPEALADARESGVEPSGTANVDVTASGPLGDGGELNVAGTVGLDGVSLAFEEIDDALTDLTGEVRVWADSVASAGVEGRLMGRPLRASFALRDLSAPSVEARVRTELDLARLRAEGFVPDSIGAEGVVAVDAGVSGPVEAPERMLATGTIDPSGATVSTPSLLQPVSFASGRLVLDGRTVRGQELGLAFGDSDLTLSFTAANGVPAALGDTSAVPDVTFDARSEYMDMDALVESDDTLKYSTLLFARLGDRPVGDRSAAEAAEAAELSIPELPEMTLEGRYRANEFVRSAVTLGDLDVRLSGSNRAVAVTDATFRLMGGEVRLAGRLGLVPEGPDGSYPAELEYDLRGVAAQAFFDAFTPFRDRLTGALDLEGSTDLRLDRHALPIEDGTGAQGTLTLSDGQLQNWEAARMLGDQLGLSLFDTLEFDDWLANFRVVGSQVLFDESTLVGSDISAEISGGFGLGGQLDIGALFSLPSDVAVQRAGGGELASTLADALGGGGGRVPVGARLTGPATDPDINVDLSQATENAREGLFDRFQSEIRQRIAPPDTTGG